MEIDEDVEVLLKGLDENNITSILTKYNEVNIINKKLDVIKESLRDKVKAYLKERQWKKYKDDKTKISVSILTQHNVKVDKELLQEMLNESQYAQITNITTFEKLMIITPEQRRKISQFVKRGKNV